MWHEYGNCMPLHHAVHNEDIPMIKLLLSSPKIDVNCKDGDGMTPIHLACLKNNLDIVKLLLETKKVDVSIKSAVLLFVLFMMEFLFAFLYRTPLECTKNQEIISILNQYSNGSWCFIA